MATVGHHAADSVTEVGGGAVRHGVDVHTVLGGSGLKGLAWLNEGADATLYATRGGSGNTSLNFGSWVVIDLQCFLTIWVIEGSLGSYSITNTGLWFPTSWFTFFRASNLGISLAFPMAVLTTPGL